VLPASGFPARLPTTNGTRFSPNTCSQQYVKNEGFSILNSQLSILNSQLSKTVPRDQYRLVQTPQTFDIQLLKSANRQPYNDGFTDDASVVEAFGHKITLVEGNRENIKITTPYDLKIAEVLI
jgi:2-C-methyl-D-erythritol 4-phosphate cytidylyltransferase